LFDTLHCVPADSEVRIQQLCREALAANTQADVERIIGVLRAALEEHIRFAKESLHLQATTIGLLDGLAKAGLATKDSPEPDSRIAAD
jgi:hypothetical protein